MIRLLLNLLSTLALAEGSSTARESETGQKNAPPPEGASGYVYQIEEIEFDRLKQRFKRDIISIDRGMDWDMSYLHAKGKLENNLQRFQFYLIDDPYAAKESYQWQLLELAKSPGRLVDKLVLNCTNPPMVNEKKLIKYTRFYFTNNSPRYVKGFLAAYEKHGLCFVHELTLRHRRKRLQASPLMNPIEWIRQIWAD